MRSANTPTPQYSITPLLRSWLFQYSITPSLRSLLVITPFVLVRSTTPAPARQLPHPVEPRRRVLRSCDALSSQTAGHGPSRAGHRRSRPPASPADRPEDDGLGPIDPERPATTAHAAGPGQREDYPPARP